jgi:two-component system, OmpR family, phosphate regulon sensor histidine kinase PhoR
MFYDSRGLAAFLSAAIGLLATSSLFFLEDVAPYKLIQFFFICVALSFVCIFPALAFFIFRQIKKIKDQVDQFNPADEAEFANVEALNPLQRISDEINSFVIKKQAEIERLKKLEAFRKDFIADISHELKTPIFAAQGFVHTLIDGAAKEKAVRKKFLKKAAKSLDGLDMLVQDLLTLSQIETGQIKMRFEEVDLFALAADVLDQLHDKSDEKQITLRIEGPVRNVWVRADGGRISQVLTNLVTNAIKHSFRKGEVVISFSEKTKSVITRVQDFGEGIPSEDIHRIFERFYRVEKSRSREKGGTGLGLAIVKHILERHESKPKVKSKPGEGAVFSFKLRRADQEISENGEHNEPADD